MRTRSFLTAHGRVLLTRWNLPAVYRVLLTIDPGAPCRTCVSYRALALDTLP